MEGNRNREKKTGQRRRRQVRHQEERLQKTFNKCVDKWQEKKKEDEKCQFERDLSCSGMQVVLDNTFEKDETGTCQKTN